MTRRRITYWLRRHELQLLAWALLAAVALVSGIAGWVLHTLILP